MKAKTKRLRGGLEPSDGQPVPKASAGRSHAEILAEALSAAVASCCSEPWADTVELGRSEWPIPGMRLGRAKVLTTGEMISNNRGTIGARRWTPPNNVRVEDMLDELSIKQAGHYYHPSAIVYGPRVGQPFDAHYDPCHIARMEGEQWITRRVVIAEWDANTRGRGRGYVVCREGTCRARWRADRCEDFPEEMRFLQVLEG